MKKHLFILFLLFAVVANTMGQSLYDQHIDAANRGDETAGLYQSQQHGMFTYFLLRKLKESKGECTLGQLSEYVQTSVKRQSVVSNRKSQTPTVALSDDLADKWKNLKLK